MQESQMIDTGCVELNIPRYLIELSQFVQDWESNAKNVSNGDSLEQAGPSIALEVKKEYLNSLI